MTGEQEKTRTNHSGREFHQVVMDGETPFSAPYNDRENANRSAAEFETEMPSHSFDVESWPNERQQVAYEAKVFAKDD